MITPHMNQDFLYYFAFLAGQFLFIFKRAASAIRSKINPISSRWEYVRMNRDVLLIRLGMELPIYYIFRHYDINTVLKVFTSWQVPFEVPQSFMFCFMLGYVVDSLLDWVGASSKTPQWFKETIPNVQVFSLHTKEAGTDEAGTPVVVEKTVTVEKIPPPTVP